MLRVRPNPADRNLRRLLKAQFLTDCSDWLDYVAILALLAFHWQAGLMVYAALALAAALPHVFGAAEAKAFCARHDARSVMASAVKLRGLIAIGLILAPGWPTLLALVFVRATVDRLLHPALDAAFARLAPAEDLPVILGSSRAHERAARIIAPVLAGGLLLSFAPDHLFFLTAGLALVASLLLWTLPVLPAVYSRSREDEPAQIRAALAETRAVPEVRAALFISALTAAVLFVQEGLMAPLLFDLGHEPAMIGLAFAALASGGALADFCPARAAADRRFWRIADGATGAAISLGGLGLLALANLSPGAAVIFAYCACLGLAMAQCTDQIGARPEAWATPERAASVARLGQWLQGAILLAAPPLGAALAATAGIGSAFIVGALALTLTARIAFVAHRRPRKATPAPANTAVEDATPAGPAFAVAAE
ncbi:MFS transporter [Frigidibacter sp. RF13]|uniref:MFS transporter n=1 Tax=Frigidibacter sp. RF13 TaxID=2997340 RepID=UPI00226EDA92|nr:MFS transporter [Frigidibacter sp. RF13]MCY1126086.1 MFS transporter [Frigidibacter sp. RF13]